MSGLTTTFQLLNATLNEAAFPLLTAGLDSPSADVRAAALRGVLERRVVAGLRKIVERVDEWNDDELQIIHEYHGRTADLLRHDLQKGDAAQVEHALRTAVRFREYDVLPAIVNAVEDAGYAHVDAAGATLVQLADELYRELATTRDERRRRDPQIARRHAVTALEQSVLRFPKHGRREPVEALLQLAARENAALGRILSEPRDPCFAPIVAGLLTGERPGVVRLLLSFLEDSRPPLASLQTLLRRTDMRFLEPLLKKIGDEPTPAIRANLRRVDSVGWLNDRRLLAALDEPQQRAVIALVQSSGLKRPDAFLAFEFLAEQGRPAARAAAVTAVADYRGPEANALVLRALQDESSAVRAAALVQLRPRGVPGSLAMLIQALDSDEPTIRDAVRSQLQEFVFRRFMPAFDLLEDGVRRMTGGLVAKVDPTSAAQLRDELTSSQTKRRVRAAEMAEAMGLVRELEDALVVAARDDEQSVRYEAARALADATTGDAVNALRALLQDAGYAIREAARDSLDRIAERTQTNDSSRRTGASSSAGLAAVDLTLPSEMPFLSPTAFGG